MSLAVWVDWDGAGARGHLDPDVFPQYFMVPEKKRGRVVLAIDGDDDDNGMSLEPEHPPIATIEKKHPVQDGRLYEVFGASVGSTFINSFKDSQRQPWRLLVDVKPERPLAIAFHSVIKDSDGAKSMRDPTIGIPLVPLLNHIFEPQCNMSLNSTAMDKISVGVSYADIAWRDKFGPKEGRHPWPEWQILVDACDPGAEINVFFVPHRTAGGNLTALSDKVLVKENKKICVFPDAMPDDKVQVALAHWIARFLGCNTTSMPGLEYYLMFYTRADGDGDLNPRGNVPFIDKDCVRKINPIGSHR